MAIRLFIAKCGAGYPNAERCHERLESVGTCPGRLELFGPVRLGHPNISLLPHGRIGLTDSRIVFALWQRCTGSGGYRAKPKVRPYLDGDLMIGVQMLFTPAEPFPQFGQNLFDRRWPQLEPPEVNHDVRLPAAVHASPLVAEEAENPQPAVVGVIAALCRRSSPLILVRLFLPSVVRAISFPTAESPASRRFAWMFGQAWHRRLARSPARCLCTGGEEAFVLRDHTVPGIPMLIAPMTTIERFCADAKRAGLQSELIQFRLALHPADCRACQADRRNHFAIFGANSGESRVEHVHRCCGSRIKHGLATVDGNPPFEAPGFEHGDAKVRRNCLFDAAKTAMAARYRRLRSTCTST